jgi:hypothetical protein
MLMRELGSELEQYVMSLDLVRSWDNLNDNTNVMRCDLKINMNERKSSGNKSRDLFKLYYAGERFWLVSGLEIMKSKLAGRKKPPVLFSREIIKMQFVMAYPLVHGLSHRIGVSSKHVGCTTGLHMRLRTLRHGALVVWPLVHKLHRRIGAHLKYWMWHRPP